MFHELLTKLDSIPEGTGTLLDNTLVVWTTEVSNGDTHSTRNMPFVFAGATDRLRTGRYIRFPEIPSNAVLVTICRAMGADVDSFGDPSWRGGPLPGVLR